MFDWFAPRRPAPAAITAEELQRRLAGPQPPFLLDVREPAEYAAGHVPGAASIPLGQLAVRVAEVPIGREVAVLCRSGARSARATDLLRTQGRDAVNVTGGMLAWRGAVAAGA